MSRKFKVGDVVRVVSEGDGHDASIGAVLTVSYEEPLDYEGELIYCAGDDRFDHWFAEDELELVQRCERAHSLDADEMLFARKLVLHAGYSATEALEVIATLRGGIE